MSRKSKLKDFHFDIGNSTDGPIGMCAVVRAESKERALEILKEAMPEDVEVDKTNSEEEGIQYIQVYLNGSAITTKDIDFADEVDEES